MIGRCEVILDPLLAHEEHCEQLEVQNLDGHLQHGSCDLVQTTQY